VGLGGAVSTLRVKWRRYMGRESVGFAMSDILGPVVAGASLGFALVFLMAVANGMSALIFNGKTITATIGGRLGGAE